MPCVDSCSRGLEETEARDVIARFVELPARRMQVTQPMARRIWELRNNLTAYDAAYVSSPHLDHPGNTR